MAPPRSTAIRPAEPGIAGLDRVLTVPNAITLVRLACIPVFLWLMLRPHRTGWYPAALLLAVLGITDGVDGFVARRFSQVSTLGKVLDPIADRLLLGTSSISIIVLGAIPLGVGLAAVVREALVAAGFLAVAALGGRRIDVTRMGKAGTFGLMVALPLFLAGHANDDWRGTAETLAWIYAVPGLALGWLAAVMYVPQARAALAAARQAREEAQP